MFDIVIAECDPGSEREVAWDLVRRVFGIAKVERTGYGKPFLPEHPDKHFNLSHTSGFSALAVSGSPVGVDVERLNRVEKLKDIDRFVDRVFCAEEKCKAATLYDVLKIWTCKEAYIKLDGRGFAHGLRTFSVFSISGIEFVQPYFDGDVLCTVAVKSKKD